MKLNLIITSQFQKRQELFYKELNLVFLHKAKIGVYEALQNLLNLADTLYREEIQDAYSNDSTTLQEMDIATLFNMNRELYSSNKAMVLALKDFLLEHHQPQSISKVRIEMQMH